ncbi:hypothetical protein [Allobaculum sp. Allo2]|uniref:hypothetical protein n=1 Tax=Allobaculum sp. Allo2 TaxID=2853432 RepID=UPI001F60DDCF|nr:hypothetical protein [Allobaculum sp. Allo2]UNT93946.1 hypothetical protein KWG61_04500 [Allobaculum sp. Allo2]
MDGGLDGFEVFAPNNTEAEKRFLLKLAGEEKSLITAGSDYHGTRRPDRKMGVTTMTGKARSVVELLRRLPSNRPDRLLPDVPADRFTALECSKAQGSRPVCSGRDLFLLLLASIGAARLRKA